MSRRFLAYVPLALAVVIGGSVLSQFTPYGGAARADTSSELSPPTSYIEPPTSSFEPETSSSEVDLPTSSSQLSSVSEVSVPSSSAYSSSSEPATSESSFSVPPSSEWSFPESEYSSSSVFPSSAPPPSSESSAPSSEPPPHHDNGNGGGTDETTGNSVELLLQIACSVPDLPLALVFTNIGDHPIEAGSRVTWRIAETGAHGTIILPVTLKPGEKVTITDLLRHEASVDDHCEARLKV